MYQFIVQNLTSLTSYSFRLQLEYLQGKIPFNWPIESDSVFCKTKGSVPGRPLTPRAKKSPDNLVELWWGPTATNGYPVSYTLEMKMQQELLVDQSRNANYEVESRRPLVTPTSHWIPIYNGSGTKRSFISLKYKIVTYRNSISHLVSIG